MFQPEESSAVMKSPSLMYIIYIRISNPNAPSNKTLKLADVYKKNENEKMKAYNDRILQVEKGSFVPLVYTTTGGMGLHATKFLKRLAHPIADKKDMEMSWAYYELS